tara:strand:- start:696 stop:1094 length:399 start_codon:yes stop_codon:yes gene_type:complete
MICFLDFPELSKVRTVEDFALRKKQRFLTETSAIYSLSCSVILLFLGDASVAFKPVDVLVYFYHQVGGNKEQECEKKKVHVSIIKKPDQSKLIRLSLMLGGEVLRSLPLRAQHFTSTFRVSLFGTLSLSSRC